MKINDAGLFALADLVYSRNLFTYAAMTIFGRVLLHLLKGFPRQVPWPCKGLSNQSIFIFFPPYRFAAAATERRRKHTTFGRRQVRSSYMCPATVWVQMGWRSSPPLYMYWDWDGSQHTTTLPEILRVLSFIHAIGHVISLGIDDDEGFYICRIFFSIQGGGLFLVGKNLPRLYAAKDIWEHRAT